MSFRLPRAFYATLLAGAACASPVQTVSDEPTSLSFAGRERSMVTAVSPSRASSDTLRAGYDELIVHRAQLAVREMAVGTTRQANCAEPANHLCRVVLQQPVVIDLPLGGAAEQRFQLGITPGAYTQLALDVHSIRIEGEFNGAPFVYEAELGARRALPLPRPMVIGLSGAVTNLTISAPVTSWFRTATGSLTNPGAVHRGTARDQGIRGAIIQSLRAFEDRDRDGDDRNG